MLQEPAIFNGRNFRNAKELSQVWKIFRRIATRADSLFIMIDRIVLCEGKAIMEISVGDDLLRVFNDLAAIRDAKLKLIVRSGEEPPVGLCEVLRLQTIVLDTQAPQRLRI